MPKLSFKRQADDESAPFSAYIPTRAIDYTSLPPIDEDSAVARFRRLPIGARVGMILLPLLLIVSGVWGVWAFLNAPQPVVAAPPPPSATLTDARVASPEVIAVDGMVEYIADGTPLTARLMVGDVVVPWADESSTTGMVTNGRIDLRLTRAAKVKALKQEAAYSVEVIVGESADVIALRHDLVVPDVLKDAFFAEQMTAAPSATPRPTAIPAPTPEPTPEPIVEVGPPTVEVAHDSALLISPTLDSAAVMSVDVGDTFAPLLRSDDSRWYLIEQEGAVGWLNGEHVTIDAARVAEILSVRPDPQAVAVGPLTARVFNGGNIRYQPSTETGTVLGQLHAGQTISVKGKTVDGEWLRVVAPEAEGWVNITLLTIDDSSLAQAAVIQ